MRMRMRMSRSQGDLKREKREGRDEREVRADIAQSGNTVESLHICYPAETTSTLTLDLTFTLNLTLDYCSFL